jgi:dsRNA-specific ribonuclease
MPTPTKNAPVAKPDKYAKFKADFAKLPANEQQFLLQELKAIFNLNQNPVTTLATLVQKKFGSNMETKVWTVGSPPDQLVNCTLTLPDGREFTASGQNQKIAKQIAAEQAITILRSEAQAEIQAKAEEQ